MRYLLKTFIKSPILLAVAILLGSCGSGGLTLPTTAPVGMGGLLLRFNNTATFEFIADAGGAAGMESGAVRYAKNAATTTSLVDILGNTATFDWPDDISFARYEYTRVGEASGEIKLFGVSGGTGGTNPDLFGGITETEPAIFSIIFEETGGFITSVQMTMEIPTVGKVIYTGDAGGQITLTNGGSVPKGYDPSTDSSGPQPSRITDGMFDSDFLSLTDSTTLVDLDFIFVGTQGGGIVSPGSTTPVTETGKTTMTGDAGALGVSEADYVLKQPLGTDDVIFELSFTGTSGPSLPANVTYTLTFTSLEAGTYVGSDGSMGTFTFFATGDL